MSLLGKFMEMKQQYKVLWLDRSNLCTYQLRSNSLAPCIAACFFLMHTQKKKLVALAVDEAHCIATLLLQIILMSCLN